LQNLG
jgi:hypothetical protein